MRSQLHTPAIGKSLGDWVNPRAKLGTVAKRKFWPLSIPTLCIGLYDFSIFIDSRNNQTLHKIKVAELRKVYCHIVHILIPISLCEMELY
jgi:hypothetical protein